MNKVNPLLKLLIPHVRNEEVVLKTTMGPMRGVIENLVVYSKCGDFYVRFSSLLATPAGFSSDELELACWEIIRVEE